MIKFLKELYQNCPDTMFLIKTIVVSSLFAAFLVLAPSEVVIPVMGVIVPIVFIIGLIIWSFRQERHLYDRDMSIFEDKSKNNMSSNERFINHLAEDLHSEVGIKIYDN